MYAILTLLNIQVHFKIEELWNWLELDCGLSGVQATPLPHFSWMGMQECDVDRVLEVMGEIAAEQTIFKAYSAGVGLFTGPAPVLYLPIANSIPMLHCHAQIWQKLAPFVSEPNLYYQTGQWFPHVTLASRDLDLIGLGCAVQGLMHRIMELEITVDHFALAYYSPSDAGVIKRFDFLNARDRV